MLRQRLVGVARVIVHAEPEVHVDRVLSANASTPHEGQSR